MHDPIAYIYEADHHCPGCALARFGLDADGYITGTDREGNEVGVVAPWDEWQQGSGEPETLGCGTCGGVIEEYVPDDYSYPIEDEAEAREVASEWHGGQASPLYAFASSGHVDREALISEARLAGIEAKHDGTTDDRELNRLARLVEWFEALPAPQESALF